MNRRAPILAGLAMLIAACGGGTPGEADDPGTIDPSDREMSAELSQEMVDDLVARAAEETGVPAEAISVVAAQAVTWSDGSLGCPQEGMAYTQALVPGYRVVLDVAGEEIHYHAGGDASFFACDDPREPAGDGTVDR